MNPLFLVDYYKVHHHRMYPDGLIKLYSNMTARKSRIPGINYVVVAGIQYVLYKYLVTEFNAHFFGNSHDLVVKQYKKFMDCTLGPDSVTVDHISALHKLGYLPLKIKALPEGSRCPIGVPFMTITNTHSDFAWLVNYIETLLSASIWQMMTSATIADHFYQVLSGYAIKTVGSDEFVQFQGHDFAARGLSSVESMMLSGFGHLIAGFAGTDTIPAIIFAQKYYDADIESELVGTSVPATEHSVMCAGEKQDEINTYRELLAKYPTGILSVVSDTWDLWQVITNHLVKLYDEIMKRDGKLVIRPDSGNPVDILCGMKNADRANIRPGDETPADKGVVELLWEIFGGTTNDKGYKQLDSHIGAIYGDSITVDRAKEICERLEEKGFASTNVVLGIGSYTYQYNTRDTFGFAIKATYAEVLVPKMSGSTIINGQRGVIRKRNIFKDPVTDDGTKRSAKGLLKVYDPKRAGAKFALQQEVTETEENEGLLETVFEDGEILKIHSLAEIRARLRNSG